MKFLKIISITFIFFGILPLTNKAFSESEDPKIYKVLASDNKNFQ